MTALAATRPTGFGLGRTLRLGFSRIGYEVRGYFRQGDSVFFTFLFPLVGGVILAVLFFTTLIDSMDPAYGSGAAVGGVGIVFVLGMLIIVVGIAIMIWQSVKRPAFFRGETLSKDAPASTRRLKEAAR